MTTKKRWPLFLSELPPAPGYNPVRKAMDKVDDAETLAVLRSFASMPASTGVLANPVRYHHSVACGDDAIELDTRSFSIRGCLPEEDIVTGAADAMSVILVGLCGRFAKAGETRQFSKLLTDEFRRAVQIAVPQIAQFMKRFPNALPELAMQYMACIRKAARGARPVNASRPPAELLRDLITVHIENTAGVACASYIRFLLRDRAATSERRLVERTMSFVRAVPRGDPFRIVFSLLLRRKVNSTEAGILGGLGTIQIHHGSAGSNMVARYLASLHTRSVEDLFTASQMAMDGARHFGAIADLSAFVSQLELVSPNRRDDLIRQRMAEGNLPAFGHPEIAAAGRNNRIELDPRPAIYLAPLFKAIDARKVRVPESRAQRVALAQRIYQIAFVQGIEKPGRNGRLRVAPNTDFGAWLVQEALGIEEPDRTLLSYVYRGFGWMMDVREQLQQPIIRPVIPPDPAIVPPPAEQGVIPALVALVHDRLCGLDAFRPALG